MKKLFGLIMISLLCVSETAACTAFAVYRDGLSLFANNEDYVWTNTYIEFIPAETGKYGRVYLGYTNIPSPQGGMNDQGLCFDTFGMPYLEVLNSVNLPYPQGDLKTMVMEQCATVEEVIDIFNMYNLTMMEYGQMIVSDRFGNSAIIEGDSIIYIDGDYQVCTNFYHSNPELGGWPCWRYNTVVNMMAEPDTITVNRAKEIIFACHQAGSYGTTYTNVFDMNTGDIKLYCRDYFDVEITLNLFDQLVQGYSFSMIENLAIAVNENENYSPENIKSYNIYPNPSTSFVNITYQISENTQCSIKIYDLSGRLVAILVEEIKYPGIYEVKWQVLGMESGTYFCHLQFGTYYETTRIAIIK